MQVIFNLKSIQIIKKSTITIQLRSQHIAEQNHKINNNAAVPMARHRPVTAAYMSDVSPALSACVTSPLLLISICRASQWSL